MNNNTTSLPLKSIGENDDDGSIVKRLWEFIWLFLIQFLSIVGNALVILTICRERRLRTNYYFLVFHLAVCDLTLAFFSSQVVLFSQLPINYGPASSKFLCVLETALADWFYLVEICLMILIAVLRYRAIVKPFKKPLKKKKLAYLTVIIYVLTWGLEIPDAVGVKRLERYCIVSWKGTTAYDAYAFSLSFCRFYLPLVIFITVYGKMCHQLFLHGKCMRNNMGKKGYTTHPAILNTRLLEASHNRNVKIVTVSIIIIVSFVVSNFPFNHMKFLLSLNFVNMDSTSRYSLWILFIYLCGTCAANPIIYALGDKALFSGYKKACGKIIACCKQKKRCRCQTPGNDF